MEEVKQGAQARVRAVVLACVVACLFACKVADAGPVKDRFWFCMEGVDGSWTLQDHAPLIDTRHGMTFAQIDYTRAWLSRVRVRHFLPEYQLEFEYKFDEAGKLTALHGILTLYGSWTGKADLYPVGTKLPELEVRYYAGNDGNMIADPEDGRYYEAAFKTAEVYRTIDEIPCSAEVQADALQRETKHAAQN